jgi:hypothetical protein
MSRYTVTYGNVAQDDLAREWLRATDRRSVTKATHEIDRILANEPHSKGTDVSEGLRKLIVEPLVVQFSVEEADRRVTIWSVRSTC